MKDKFHTEFKLKKRVSFPFSLVLSSIHSITTCLKQDEIKQTLKNTAFKFEGEINIKWRVSME